MPPWSLQALLEKYKEKGLPIAENMVEELLEATTDWISESAAADDKSWNDFIIPLMPLMKSAYKPLVDKIDGQPG